MTIFRNATVVEFDPPRIREGMDVVVEGDSIAAVEAAGASGGVAGASGSAGGTADARVIDLHGKILMPGLVNSHTHYYSALARGIIADLGPMPDFVSILKQLWWRLDQAIDLDILYYSGLTGALDAIRCGATSVIDHNAAANVITGVARDVKTRL